MKAIDLTALANKFEDDLNAVLNNPEIRFKIWSDAGKYQSFKRDGNIVTHYINGNLRRVTSANDANDLVMGVNGLSLDFAIPIKQPRTNTSQTSEELAEIKDGQYPFVAYITNAINAYFEKAQTFEVKDDKNVYAVGLRAGMNTTGIVDNLPLIGNSIQVNVYIEVYYVQSGVISKNVKLTVDGQNVPYQALRWGRSPMVERSVYSGTTVSQNVISSTAFAVDVDLPVTINELNSLTEYLLAGKPNVGHFLNLTINNKEYNFFMTLNTAQSSAQGISVAGNSVSFMEIGRAYFGSGVNPAGRFVLPNSAVRQVTAQIEIKDNPYDGEFLAFIGGKCKKCPLDFKLDITPEMIIYDKENKAYYLDVVFAYPALPTVSNPQADGIPISFILG